VNEHKRINHSSKVYVMGDVHTNTIEGFWSLARIIHIFEDNKSLLCYKHVV